MDEMNEPHTREVPFNTDDKEMLWLVLLPVLEHSPLLERITLPISCNADSLPNLTRVFQVRSNHQLQHLDINFTHHKSIDGIREFFGLVGCDVRGLQPLQITDFSAVKPAIIAEYFSLSLCDLSLTPFIDIQTFSIILGRLPNLRSLEMKVHLDIDVRVETEALLQASWAYLGLRKLVLTMQSGSSDIRLAGHVFDQIGRLGDLEELRVDGDQYHFKLKDGYLGRLEGLKRLKELVIRPSGYKIHQREVQWMVDHWGCLSLLGLGTRASHSFYFNHHRNGRYSDSIKRLIERRSWIQIEIGGETIYSQHKKLATYRKTPIFSILTIRQK
ncbi:hypothetical protein BGZ46_002277 [Entomortierella lignicola]|nr:hypothetical protein BGZ46_002277 [Entomortierella lignicola]